MEGAVPSRKPGSSGDATELVGYVRSRIPVRARMLGQEKLQDIVLMAVAAWPIDRLLEVERKSGEEAAILGETSREIERTFCALYGDRRSGSILLAILLPAVLSAVIQVILKWWLEKRSRRMKMAIWQYDLKGRAR